MFIVGQKVRVYLYDSEKWYYPFFHNKIGTVTRVVLDDTHTFRYFIRIGVDVFACYPNELKVYYNNHFIYV